MSIAYPKKIHPSTLNAQALGKKVGMTTIFDSEDNAIPVTIVELLPMTITQIKTPDSSDGYSAIQVGVVNGKEKHVSKPEQGHLKKNGLGLFRKLREFRVTPEALGGAKVGDVINVLGEGSLFEEGKKLNVTGRSIGKGFQGATKRWGFSRGPMSHGSKSHRIPGSIGPGTTPGRVFKGKKMAGHMGDKNITTKHLTLTKVMPEKNLLLIQGSVPGVEGGLLTIRLSK